MLLPQLLIPARSVLAKLGVTLASALFMSALYAISRLLLFALVSTQA